MSNEKIHARPKKATLTETVGRLLALGLVRRWRSQMAGGTAACAGSGGSNPPEKTFRKAPAK